MFSSQQGLPSLHVMQAAWLEIRPAQLVWPHKSLLHILRSLTAASWTHSCSQTTCQSLRYARNCCGHSHNMEHKVLSRLQLSCWAMFKHPPWDTDLAQFRKTRHECFGPNVLIEWGGSCRGDHAKRHKDVAQRLKLDYGGMPAF